MQPNIAVEWLRLLVDPADSSYMPTLLVVSVGDSLTKMRELASVRVTPSDTWVTLIRSLKEVGLTVNTHTYTYVMGIMRRKRWGPGRMLSHREREWDRCPYLL